MPSTGRQTLRRIKLCSIQNGWSLRRPPGLMLEMPNACEDHRHVMLIRCVDDLLIFDRPAGLDHGTDASLGSYIDAIPKREKRVRSKDTALDG